MAQMRFAPTFMILAWIGMVTQPYSSPMMFVNAFSRTTRIIHSDRQSRIAPALCGEPRLTQSFATRQLRAPAWILGAGREDQDTIDITDNEEMSKIPSTPFDRPILSLIDAAMLIVFAAVGKASHNTLDGSLDLAAVAQTAGPFLVSWFAVAPFLGCFTPMATGDWKESAITTTKAWIVAIPLGCALRGILKGYIPPLPFVIVTLIATWVLLVGGRSVYTIVSEFIVETF